MRYIIVGDSFANALQLFNNTSIYLMLVDSLNAGDPPATLADDVRRVAAKYPKATVIFMAGNNDIQIRIYCKAIEGNIDLNVFILSSVYRWCKWIRELDLVNPIGVCCAMLPTVAADYHPESLVQFMGIRNNRDALIKLYAFLHCNPQINNLECRIEIVELWNHILREACSQKIELGRPTAYPTFGRKCPLGYIDCNWELLKEGMIDEKFCHLNPINNLLLWEPQIDIWKKRLGLTDDDLIVPTNNNYINQKKYTITQR